jgi:hypothetical protein
MNEFIYHDYLSHSFSVCAMLFSWMLSSLSSTFCVAGLREGLGKSVDGDGSMPPAPLLLPSGKGPRTNPEPWIDKWIEIFECNQTGHDGSDHYSSQPT